MREMISEFERNSVGERLKLDRMRRRYGVVTHWSTEAVCALPRIGDWDWEWELELVDGFQMQCSSYSKGSGGLRLPASISNVHVYKTYILRAARPKITCGFSG